MPAPALSDADLIAKLSEAEEGSRELDLLVYNHVTVAVRGDKFALSLEELRAHDEHQMGYVLHYTTSIDAALVLMPGGWTRSVDATVPESGINVNLYEPTDDPVPHLEGDVVGTHVVEAIATCIAIVKGLERCRVKVNSIT